MRRILAEFNLENGMFADYSSDLINYEDEGCRVMIYGRAESGSGINDAAGIRELFRNYGTKLTEHLSGVFFILVYDKENKFLYVFQDRVTGPVALYYIRKDNSVFIGTSLKALLMKSGIKRKLNEKAVGEFLVNGFIYGNETLAENVYKIRAYCCLVIGNGEIKEQTVLYPFTQYTAPEALEAFRNTIDSAIDTELSGLDEISMPLSSGYDSNYIAYRATADGKVPVTAFSVGGASGKSELPVVEQNVRFYKNMTLCSARTDPDILQRFPDIVWRLEGNVYESGIFLQYVLMSLVASNGKKTLVCGEVADQVMNMNYLRSDRIHPLNDTGEPLYYEFSDYPYIFSSYLILKKSGILAESFGIETRYPYINEKLISVCGALGPYNRKDKRIHVANCEECLPPQVTSNMKKIGGSTDCHSLFGSQKDIKEFFRRVEHTRFFRSHRKLIEKYSATAKEKQKGMTLLKTKIRNLVLSILHVKHTDFFFEEMKIREYLCVVYLFLFEKLILSDSADLSADSCNKTLDELLS